MKKLFKTVLSFIILALLIEVVILISTKVVGWNNLASGRPFLAAVHVHLFALGVLFFLIQMLLEKNFNITKAKFYNVFYIVFLSGLGLFMSVLLYKGFGQIFKFDVISGLTQGAAAIAHTAMFVGLFFFAYSLYEVAVKPTNKKEIEKKEETK